MALNCVMLKPDATLLPLPGEKVFLSVASVAVSLKSSSASTPVKPLANTGTIHVSNKRIAFVSNTAASLPNPSGSLELKTFSTPLSHFHNGRFLQPFFSSNYYEADIRPVHDGGLSEPHLLKIDFKEGRGYEFTQAVEEVKARFDEDTNASARRQIEVESLPLYDASSAPPVVLPQTTSSAPLSAPGSARRNDSMPTEEDLSVAECARDQEAQETENAEAARGLPPIYHE